MTPTAARDSLPVIVVGGGPVGMTFATTLGQRGIPVVLVESEPVAKTDWRASTFHPPTLELLHGIGVVEQMHAEGLAVPRYQYRDRRTGVVAEFDFGVLAGETPYPYRLQLNQQHLVRMLVERAARLDALELRFGSRVTGLVQRPGGVEVTLRTSGGEERVEGSYVVGADGASSTVRNLLGTSFEGFTYPERFLIVSTSVDMRRLLPDIADVNYIADPREWLFLLHTPESWRAVYPVPPERDREAATDPDDLQAHLQGIVPYPDGYPIIDSQLYNVNQRIAGEFRVGRGLLIGDAAHINSPLGGVGLNSGIHDAIDLARRFTRIWFEGAEPEAELDAFADLRRRVAVEYVQADTRRNTERLSERDETRRAEYHAQLRAIANDPGQARAWCRRASLLESVQRFGIGLPPGSPPPVSLRPGSPPPGSLRPGSLRPGSVTDGPAPAPTPTG